MAEDAPATRYVKLSKVQDAPAEEIRPGELNQPVRVPQLEVKRCGECGQPLPERYAPPRTSRGRPESSGASRTLRVVGLDCFALVCGIALAIATAAFHGIDPRTSFLIGEGLFFAWWMCGIYTGISRQSLQKKYHLKNSPCDPCMVHCCMHWCAICQEHREMKGRLSDSAATPMTVVNPPPLQEMNANESRSSAPAETADQRNSHHHANWRCKLCRMYRYL
uniref:Cell number regulator 6 n=1 Tax=Ananas comosus var. bracteatus TaxID=296719 RepID=A0A6V7NK93_ANACO|nr:unnamed protein product [Ananas comosus var. bracteatus]